MLTRDLSAVANFLVELSSVKHTPQIHQHNSHQYNTHSSRVTKFVSGRTLPLTLLGSSRRSPWLRIWLGMGTPFPNPHYTPLTHSVSPSKHLAVQPLHWIVPIVPILRNDNWFTLRVTLLYSELTGALLIVFCIAALSAWPAVWGPSHAMRIVITYYK